MRTRLKVAVQRPALVRRRDGNAGQKTGRRQRQMPARGMFVHNPSLGRMAGRCRQAWDECRPVDGQLQPAAVVSRPGSAAGRQMVST